MLRRAIVVATASVALVAPLVAPAVSTASVAKGSSWSGHVKVLAGDSWTLTDGDSWT